MEPGGFGRSFGGLWGNQETEINAANWLLFVLDFDAKLLQELEILVVDLELGVGGESGDERSFVGRLFALLADTNGGFKDQKNVVAALFDARDYFGNLFRIGERFVDGFAEFLH